jgi:beta-glucosidase
MSNAARFPDGFLWGAATSAYQIEGSPLADGAGPSIWHVFAHTPGRTANGDTGDVACDHYRRYPEDLRLMGELGLNAYRFSLSWSRIIPTGTGAVNPKGLAFYDRLVDLLLAQRIEPMVTLFHWDLPAALEDRGGWLNRDSADWFAEYAAVAVTTLGDRVGYWATLNEPWVVTDGGYLHGVLAPGHRNRLETPIASHHLLLAHGRGIQAIRAAGGRQAGLVVNLEPKYPVSQQPEDGAATRRADAYMNRQYLDPVFRGEYPAELAEMYGTAWPRWPATDFDLIRQPLDYLGINYYTRAVIRYDATVDLLAARAVPQSHQTHTEMGWEVCPEGLTDVLVWVHQRYGSVPLYITENGAAFFDPPVADGDEVKDPLRVAYLADHIRAARRAIAAGVDLRGYFAWSLLDNFEWSAGYDKRFGLVHVDFKTQQRTLKSSARFYANVIRTNGAVVPP